MYDEKKRKVLFLIKKNSNYPMRMVKNLIS